METSQPDQVRPRLIVNPVIQAYGRRFWCPREDLPQLDSWLRENGYWPTRYRNTAGHTIEVTRGGLVSATGTATRDMLEALAVENQRAGVDVHVINAWRRTKMSRGVGGQKLSTARSWRLKCSRPRRAWAVSCGSQ